MSKEKLTVESVINEIHKKITQGFINVDGSGLIIAEKENRELVKLFIQQIKDEVIEQYDNLSDVTGDYIKAVPVYDINEVFQKYLNEK